MVGHLDPNQPNPAPNLCGKTSPRDVLLFQTAKWRTESYQNHKIVAKLRLWLLPGCNFSCIRQQLHRWVDTFPTQMTFICSGCSFASPCRKALLATRLEPPLLLQLIFFSSLLFFLSRGMRAEVGWRRGGRGQQAGFCYPRKCM